MGSPLILSGGVNCARISSGDSNGADLDMLLCVHVEELLACVDKLES